MSALPEDDPYAAREASVAFNVNVLRGLLVGTDLPRDVREAGLLAVERIAAQMPKHATAPDGRLAWQHNCGQVAYGLGLPPFCPTCVIGPTPDYGTWQALYTVGGTS